MTRSGCILRSAACLLLHGLHDGCADGLGGVRVSWIRLAHLHRWLLLLLVDWLSLYVLLWLLSLYILWLLVDNLLLLGALDVHDLLMGLLGQGVRVDALRDQLLTTLLIVLHLLANPSFSDVLDDAEDCDDDGNAANDGQQDVDEDDEPNCWSLVVIVHIVQLLDLGPLMREITRALAKV